MARFLERLGNGLHVPRTEQEGANSFQELPMRSR